MGFAVPALSMASVRNDSSFHYVAALPINCDGIDSLSKRLVNLTAKTSIYFLSIYLLFVHPYTCLTGILRILLRPVVQWPFPFHPTLDISHLISKPI